MILYKNRSGNTFEVTLEHKERLIRTGDATESQFSVQVKEVKEIIEIKEEIKKPGRPSTK